MTLENTLDSSLRFLRDIDEGGFSYYKSEDKSIGYLPHLNRIGVPEKDWLKIILHLANDGYIEVNPQMDELKGNFPKQIKITLQGIIFINKGGYIGALLREKKNNRRFWIPIAISGFALTISILSYLQSYNSNHSDISLTNDKLVNTIFKDSTGQRHFFAFQRATITNDGGRPITLRGFIPHPDLDLILLTESGSNETVKHNVGFKIFLLPDTLTSERLFSKERNLLHFDNQGLEKLTMVNKVINPGEICTISMGIILDLFSDTTKQYSSVILCGQLFFSNGQKLDFGSGADIENN